MSSSQDFDLDTVFGGEYGDEAVDFDDFAPVNHQNEEMEEEEGENDDELDAPREHAIEQIEKMTLSVLKQLTAPSEEDEDNSTKRPRYKKLEIQLADRKKVMVDGSCGWRAIRFPGGALSRGAASRAFAQLLRVLDLMHEALIEDIPVTKRDMFYKDVPLFKTQSIVDKLVDDLAATFSLERSDLNVRATSKGLVCGSGFVIHLREGEVIQVNDTEGALIPVGEDIVNFEVDDSVCWVLVVEKEAVFQTLCRHRLTNNARLPGRGLIITGKGYPDVATRELVKTLSDNLPDTVPIMALVDGDAYGIDILSVYKHGSMSMRHESAKLAAERVQWIGLKASELSSLDVDKDALIQMSVHDEKKALSMLKRDATVMPVAWRKELMHMLHSRRKAEIEILSTVSQDNDGRNDDTDQDSDDDGKRSTTRTEEHDGAPRKVKASGLVDYLVSKINVCMSGAAREEADV